jgi:hypothetical protein
MPTRPLRHERMSTPVWANLRLMSIAAKGCFWRNGVDLGRAIEGRLPD